MNDRSLVRQFQRIGAEARVGRMKGPREGRLYDVDLIDGGRQGDEVFNLSYADAEEVEMQVIDVDRDDRHLLLLVKQLRNASVEKHRYLCGHDERSWFVAAVPNQGRVAATTVDGAKEALKPEEVVAAQHRLGGRRKNRHRRRNAAYLRQGEWFLIPSPNVEVDMRGVLRREPLSRGRGKPHLAEEAFRTGGTTVYVSRQYPHGVPEETYRKLLKQDPRARSADWRVMKRDPEVYCRGRLTHPDHATLRLRGWHRALPNTESQAPWMVFLSFLD
ncbi:MAG: hypothetical protein JRH20_23170 [Deltaproteobacteria bacterium]|nr:hypothetical protein [Deltaproteobacteria bacterium]